MSVVDPLPPPAPRSSGKTVAIAIVIVLVAFVSGAAAGILLTHLHMLRQGRLGAHMMVPRLLVHRLESSLDLSKDQRVRVEEIIERHHRRINALTDAVRPQVRQEIEAANREIEAILTPEQRVKYEKLKLRLGHREGRSRMGSTR